MYHTNIFTNEEGGQVDDNALNVRDVDVAAGSLYVGDLYPIPVAVRLHCWVF